MVATHIDITTGLDGTPVVLACIDVAEADFAALAHAVRAVRADRYRNADLSADDVVAMRELTALTDELADVASREGISTLVLRPARLAALRDAVEEFVAARDAAEWLREEDREPLARVRAMAITLADLCADALRAAIASAEPAPAS
jgi:hypothetical protein